MLTNFWESKRHLTLTSLQAHWGNGGTGKLLAGACLEPGSNKHQSQDTGFTFDIKVSVLSNILNNSECSAMCDYKVLPNFLKSEL